MRKEKNWEVEKVEKVTSNVRKRNSGNFGQRCLGRARYKSQNSLSFQLLENAIVLGLGGLSLDQI